MKTRRILLAILAMLLPLVAMAETVEIDGICYNIVTKAKIAEVVKKTSGDYSGEIIIPSNVTYQGVNCSVTSISEYTFRNCSRLTSVTIPNSLTSIGQYTFQSCSRLTSVTIPNSVTSIGSYAFHRCTGLTSVTIPNSVTSIEGYVFQDCTSLTSVTIPNSVTSIGENSFYGCTRLTSVTIPNSVTSIGQYAFSNTGLTSVTIPNSVTYIGQYAFQGCASLTSVTIPNSVTTIGEYAFAGCSGLTSVAIPNSVTGIGPGVFQGCSGLTSVTIPNSVISIESHAFQGCTSLSSVTIPNSVTSIAPYTFHRCTGLTSVTIPNSVTSIAPYTFSYTGLTSVTIPNSVISIESHAFQGCTSLSSVTIPNSVTSIGHYAFSYTGLTSVTIPNSVTYIGQYAFQGCTSLSSVTIPNSVRTIHEYAFSGCSRLTSVTIPNSVTYIGQYAFGDCENLTDVTCLAKNVPTTNGSAFNGSYIDYATLYVYESSIDAYKSREPWKNFKYIVAAYIPMYSLTYIVDGVIYKTVKYEEGDNITPEPEPTRDGFVFSGWSEIPTIMPAHDVTVTGTFTVNNTKYTLTYMVDGEVYKTYQLKCGSTIIPEPEPQKEGYTFSGWSEIPEEMPDHDVTITGTFIKQSLGKCAAPTISVVNGDILFDCEMDGVDYHYTIVSNVDALSGTAGKVIIPATTYQVSVYASKDGYEDSDVTTKEIKLPAGGDANGDGVINAADIVTITNLIMSDEE